MRILANSLATVFLPGVPPRPSISGEILFLLQPGDRLTNRAIREEIQDALPDWFYGPGMCSVDREGRTVSTAASNDGVFSRMSWSIAKFQESRQPAALVLQVTVDEFCDSDAPKLEEEAA